MILPDTANAKKVINGSRPAATHGLQSPLAQHVIRNLAFVFQIKESVFLQMRQGGLHSLLMQRQRKRRIDENHIKSLVDLLRPDKRVDSKALHGVLRLQFGNDGQNRRRRLAILFQQHHASGAVACRFQPQCPATSEHVQKRRRGKIAEKMAQPVEKRLAHARRCWPQSVAQTDGHGRSFIASGNDANRAVSTTGW